MASRPHSQRRKLLALVTALLVATAGAEVLLRQLPTRVPGELFYQDAGRQETLPTEAAARGLVVPVDAIENPHGRLRFAPNAHFWLCYRDRDRLGCEWLDEQGCVEVRLNAWGLRERSDLAPDNKRPGEQRIVCIGDSFTFGWGVPVEQCWVRLLEGGLRAGGLDASTINCGAAGAIVVDEYWWALQHRFGAFQPDVVVVTLCLNDLLPSSGLFVPGPVADTGSRLLDRLSRFWMRDPLDLDPGIDWVGLLLALPQKQGEDSSFYGPDKPFRAMWSQQAPQTAMRAMKEWCRARGIRLLVTMWPFLQGLGPGASYPFARMHALVAGFCETEAIPFLDLLPVLQGTPAEQLWVTPADMHANPRAHRLATPALTAFVLQHTR